MFLLTEVKSALQRVRVHSDESEKTKCLEGKINGWRAAAGEIAFGVYLNCSGPGPRLSQENRSAGALQREICVFLCLARFSPSPTRKHGRPRLLPRFFLSYFFSLFHLDAALGHVPDRRPLLSNAAALLIVWSGLVWSGEMRTRR